jgi:hypothetical protein
MLCALPRRRRALLPAADMMEDRYPASSMIPIIAAPPSTSNVVWSGREAGGLRGSKSVAPSNAVRAHRTAAADFVSALQVAGKTKFSTRLEAASNAARTARSPIASRIIAAPQVGGRTQVESYMAGIIPPQPGGAGVPTWAGPSFTFSTHLRSRDTGGNAAPRPAHPAAQEGAPTPSARAVAVPSTPAADADGEIRPMALAPTSPAGGMRPLGGSGGSGGGTYTIDYHLSGITTSPTPVYVNEPTLFTAQASGNDAWAATYVWTVSPGDGSSQQISTGSSNSLYTGFSLAANYVVSVIGTVAIQGSTATETAQTMGAAKPIKLDSISLDHNTIHQYGFVHYKATFDPPNKSAPITWEYKKTTDTNWTQFGGGQKEFDQVEGSIGTFDIRATVVSGGVPSVKPSSLTVLPRPVDSTTANYLAHWANEPPNTVWANGTLSVERPASGEKTYMPSAKVTLSFTRGAGAVQDDEWGQISGFKFTLAGKSNAGPWQNISLDQPLQLNGGTYSVSFNVPVSGGPSGTYAFDIYAEMPAAFNWGFDPKHYTLWKNSGTISWAIDNNGVYTSISTSGLSSQQAQNVASTSPPQSLPVRNVDHP